MRKRSIVIVGVLAVSLYLVVRRSPSDAPEPTTHVFMLEELANDPRGRLDDLSVAVEITKRHSVRWGELQRERPGRPLAELPEAETAVAALGRWARDRHAPPAPLAYHWRMHSLGKIAVETATSGEPSGIETAQLVGHRLLMEGVHIMDGTIGAGLLKLARARSRELGLRPTTWWVPPPNALARVLAAEALFMHRYADLPAGERERIVAFWAEVLERASHQTAAEIVARFKELAPARLGDLMRADTLDGLAQVIAELQLPG